MRSRRRVGTSSSTRRSFLSAPRPGGPANGARGSEERPPRIRSLFALIGGGLAPVTLSPKLTAHSAANGSSVFLSHAQTGSPSPEAHWPYARTRGEGNPVKRTRMKKPIRGAGKNSPRLSRSSPWHACRRGGAGPLFYGSARPPYLAIWPGRAVEENSGPAPSLHKRNEGRGTRGNPVKRTGRR